jgi:enamine deaminase RidA (YjgF/YER057c/UK114 family)
MATQTVMIERRPGIGVAATQGCGMRHVYAAASPCGGATVQRQAEDVLCRIEAALRKQCGPDSVVQQTVFVADAAYIEPCRSLIADFHGSHPPATSYVVQPPCDGQMLSVEALGVARQAGDVEIERRGSELVRVRCGRLTWTFGAAASSSREPTGRQTEHVLNEMQRMLADCGTDFEHVARTWCYIGGIVAEEGQGVRYHEFNRGRDDFYRDIHFRWGAGSTPAMTKSHAAEMPRQDAKPVYPASTGIGTQGDGIALAVAALQSEQGVTAVALENPRQTAACDYAAGYSPRSPKFSRAMLLASDGLATIYVSGTASITDSETRHIGDAAVQTRETLENIEALISEENVCRHGLSGLGTSLDGVAVARVYVKRLEDYAAVRAVCDERLGGIPISYVIADVCRPELLTEIECVAFSRRVAVPPPLGVGAFLSRPAASRMSQ